MNDHQNDPVGSDASIQDQNEDKKDKSVSTDEVESTPSASTDSSVKSIFSSGPADEFHTSLTQAVEDALTGDLGTTEAQTGLSRPAKTEDDGFEKVTAGKEEGQAAGFEEVTAGPEEEPAAGFEEVTAGKEEGQAAGFEEVTAGPEEEQAAGFEEATAGKEEGQSEGFEEVTAGQVEEPVEGFEEVTAGQVEEPVEGFEEVTARPEEGQAAGFEEATAGKEEGQSEGFEEVTAGQVEEPVEGFEEVTAGPEEGQAAGFEEVTVGQAEEPAAGLEEVVAGQSAGLEEVTAGQAEEPAAGLEEVVAGQSAGLEEVTVGQAEEPAAGFEEVAAAGQAEMMASGGREEQTVKESEETTAPPEADTQVAKDENAGAHEDAAKAEGTLEEVEQELVQEPGPEDISTEIEIDETLLEKTEKVPKVIVAESLLPVSQQTVRPADPKHIQVQLANNQRGDELPMAGGPGSQPAPFDPTKARVWQALLAEYDRELAVIGEGPAAANLYYESGRIWEEKLAQPKNAWEAYNYAFRLHPQLVPNIRAARRLASHVGNWSITIQIVDSEIEAVSDPLLKSQLLQSKGLLLEEKLGKLDEARAAYYAALEYNSNSVELLRQIERLAILASDYKTVADARTRLLSLLEDERSKIQLLLSLARIYQSQLEDQAEAERCYRQALELEPDNRVALRAMCQICATSKQYEELLDLIQKDAQQCSDPAHAANLYFRAARICREQLGEEERAIHYLNQALALAPNDQIVLEEMSQLYENLMRWQELVEVFEKQVNVITDQQELVSLYFKLGNIWEEKLFNEDRAIPAYQKVVELSPTYLPALQALGKLFYRKGQWEDLVKMYEVEIRETVDHKQRSIKLYKLAEILEERLGQDEEAIKKLEQAIELSPGYLPTLKALGRLYSKYNHWESLVQMYESELTITSDLDQAVFLLDKIGTLWDEKLNNIDKAIASYQRILERAPNYVPAIRTLGKLYVRADRWEDLIRINELEAQLINDQKQVISLLHRNGEIYEEKLNDKDQAIETYKQVLTLAPAYLPALQSLGRLYFIKGLWDELIKMYRQEIDVTRNESQQITLLYKIGELYEEKLVQEDNAISAYREVLSIQAGHFPAMKALIRIFGNKRDWQNLLEVLEQEAKVLEDPQQKAMSLYKVAEIWEQQLNQADKATETLQRVLQIVPTHGPSIQALVRLYTEGKAWRELVAMYERELINARSDFQMVEILYQMAEIFSSEINDMARAAETYERILTIDSEHLPSLEALERIYLIQHNYPALLRVYQAQANLSRDPKLQLALQSQMADIKENRLDRPLNAADNYLNMLKLDPTHSQAIRSLDSLYHKFGTWHGLRMLYEQELSTVASKEESKDLCMRIADLAECRLDLQDVAIHYYREALNLDPDYLPAIKALKRIYGHNNDSQALLAVLEREGKTTHDPHQAIATLLQAGELYENRFDKPDRAIECYFKVLERDPREQLAFGHLEALLLNRSDFDNLAILYRNRIGVVTDDSRMLADLQLKLGSLLLDKLNRPEEAAQCYREVLHLNPSHLTALAALSRICFGMGDWDETIKLSKRLVDLAHDSQLQAEANLRLGIIYQERKQDLDRAVGHFEKVVELDPHNAENLNRLRMIYSARQQWPRSVEILDRLIQVDEAGRIGHMLEQANIYELGLDQAEQAMAVYQQVLQLDPSNVLALGRLSELYSRLERFEELIQCYQTTIQLLTPERRAEAIALHLKMGKLYSDQLKNVDKAIIEYKKVIQLDEKNLAANEVLAELYGRTSLYYANAVDQHRRLLQIDPFRLDSYHELARIFEEQRAYDKRFCVCSVLHFLRAGNQEQEYFYGENQNKISEKATERLSAEEIERWLIHPLEDPLVRKVLQIVGGQLSKIYPADLGRYGVGKADRARPDDPVRKLTEILYAKISDFNWDLYRSSQPTHLLFVENTSPPSIITGEGLVKRTQVKEQRFALGRALGRIMDGSFLVKLLSQDQLATLIAAALQPYCPDAPVVEYAKGLTPEFVKKVQKALPRRSRKELESLVRNDAQDLVAVPDYAQHLVASEHSANRTGLAMGNDLTNAIMHLSREIPALESKKFNSTQEIIDGLRPHASIVEIIRFSLSEEYFSIRTRLKSSINP